MKLKFLLSLLIITLIQSFKSNAQNCAVLDKKDVFTNVRIIETSEVKVYGAPLDVNEHGFFLSFQIKMILFFSV